MKPEKPKGKKEQDQEMRMPAAEFDRIMQKAFQGAPEAPAEPKSGAERRPAKPRPTHK